MKTRAALLVAVICCAAVTWLNLLCVRQVISNQQHEIREQKRSLSDAETDLGGLRTQLERTSAALRQSQDAEEATRRDKESLKLESAAELLKARQELEHVRAELGAIDGVISSEFAKTGKQIFELQKSVDIYSDENKVLREKVRRMEMERSYIHYCPDFQSLPAELRGKVVACDPKWRFVVVNVGHQQGAKPRGELLVSRNGQLIGWLVISSVEKDRCIANVKQGWQLTDVLEGDSIMPAHPQSYLDLFL